MRNKVEQSNRRKTVSPPEDRKADRMKRVKRGDTSYAEECRESKRGEVDPRDRETYDSGDDWIVQMGRKERRRIRERRNNEKRRPPVNEGRRERLPRIRNRLEALLVKVREDEEWFQTCKDIGHDLV